MQDKLSVFLRMPPERVRELEKLKEVNGRPKGQLIEILVHEAYMEWRQNPDARIDP